MLSLANINSSSAATNYYEKDDYYAKDDAEHKNTSCWYGKGAKKLNLYEAVEKEDFKAILNGKLPNGTRLGRKEDNEIIHAPGIDLTFSAPKSVSIVAEVQGDIRIYEAQKKAVLKTLDYIEKNLMQTRKKMDGELVHEKAPNMLVALFKHSISRNHDPQMHTHCVLANAVERKDKQWRSAFFGKIFDNKLFLGQIYRTELAYELISLGYELRMTGSDSRFELKNIPDSLIKAFSSRSKDIANAAESYENVDAKLKAELTLRTREHKKEFSKERLVERWEKIVQAEAIKEQQLHEIKANSIEPFIRKNNSVVQTVNYINNKWQTFCEKFELTKLKVVRHIGEATKSDVRKTLEEKAINYAVNHVSERASVWKEKEMLKVAMSYVTGHSTFDKLIAQIEQEKAKGNLLIAKNELKELGFLTTKTALEKEIQTIGFMKSGQGAINSICTLKKVNSYLEQTNLNKGQQDALKLILTSTDRVVGVQGYAGVGKTYMLRSARKLAEREGYKVIGLAPTKSAANTLEKDSGIQSQTLHKFLFEYDGLIHGRGTVVGRIGMRQKMNNTIVVLDEASLASTSQYHALLKISKELDFKVVSVGDLKQLSPVEEGKPFCQAQKNGMKTAIMGEIVRQKNSMLKSAVYESINGNIKASFDKLKNSIIESDKRFDHKEDRNKCLGNLAANEWLRLSKEDRKKTLIVSPSHQIREFINQEIRQQLQFEGELRDKVITISTLRSKNLSDTQMTNLQSYQAGDIVLFNRRYNSIKVEKGEYLTVKEIKNRLVILKNQNGHIVEWQPEKVAGNRKGAIEVYQNNKLAIQVGEILKWTKNGKIPEVVNTKKVIASSINEKTITLKSECGKVFNLDQNNDNLKHLDYAYATTAHAAQGMTYDRVIGVLESDHLHLTTQKLFYVTISRARDDAKIITDNKTKLQETLTKQTGEIVSAQEHQEVKQIAHKESSKNKVELSSNSTKPQNTSKLISSFQPIYTTKDPYIQIFDKLPSVLPEFGFKRYGGYYVSCSTNKVDGSHGKMGKVYVYANNPGILVDYTRGNKSIWDYVRSQYMPAASKGELMEYLCDMAGVSNSKGYHTIKDKLIAQPLYKLPERPLELESKLSIDRKILINIYDYAKKTLFQNGNSVLNYLQNKRGYDVQTIKDMELGAILSKRELGKHLRSVGCSEIQIKEAYKILHYIGNTHNLIIPYKDVKGELIGFAARNINYQVTHQIGKYLYIKGLLRSNSLLNIHNLKGFKEVILVEGMLDSLQAQAKGLNNILALGGTACNDKQLQLLNHLDVKTITLCLDNDRAGKEAAVRIKDLISNSKYFFKVKEISLPLNIKDPDQMIKEKGVDAFKQLIKEAVYWSIEKANKTSIYSFNFKKECDTVRNNKLNDKELEK